MSKIRSSIIILIIALMLSACAGKDVVKPNNNTTFPVDATNTEVIPNLNISENVDVKEDSSPAESVTEYESIVSHTQEEETKPDISETEKETQIEAFICTVSVRCDEILDNLDRFDKSKYNLIPEDGVIYFSENVEFNDGESAFDILLRETKKNKIHLEFEYTPMFESSYVEGIGNIYEFDCGDMSGWIYKVNGKMAPCGSSQYLVKENDVIEWIYSCKP